MNENEIYVTVTCVVCAERYIDTRDEMLHVCSPRCLVEFTEDILSRGSDDESVIVSLYGKGDNQPSDDPDQWVKIHDILTEVTCPDCEATIGMMLGLIERLDMYVSDAMTVSKGWTEGYVNPVYLYCIRWACSWYKVGEWERIRPYLETS